MERSLISRTTVDLIEAQVEPTGIGSASQSVQIAPFDANYRWDNSSANAQITDPSRSVISAYFTLFVR